MLRLADDAQRVTRQAEAGVVSRLRIARPPDVLPLPVPRAMRRFAAVYSGRRASRASSSSRARRSTPCARDLLDVAVVCLPAPVAGLTVTTVVRGGAPSSPCRTRIPACGQAAFPIEQLDGTTPILLPRSANPPFYDAVMACARSAGITLAPRRDRHAPPSSRRCSPSSRGARRRCCRRRSRIATRSRACASCRSPSRRRGARWRLVTRRRREPDQRGALHPPRRRVRAPERARVSVRRSRTRPESDRVGHPFGVSTAATPESMRHGVGGAWNSSSSSASPRRRRNRRDVPWAVTVTAARPSRSRVR